METTTTDLKATDSTTAQQQEATATTTTMEATPPEIEQSNDNDDKAAMNEADATPSSSGCCYCCHFDGNTLAQGYNLHGLGRGPIYMCTIFLSTALIFLASKEVGCTEIDPDTNKEVIVEDCDVRVYGAFRPASLITNIATISGVLIALFLPIIGAILDYTPHRWTVGVVTAILLIVTEAIQIGTSTSTWFGMAILEAFSGLLFETQIISSLAYLPDLSRLVNNETIVNKQVAIFVMVEVFIGQALYVFVVVAIGTFFGLTDLGTAQVGQVLVVVWSGLGFFLGWRKLPKVPAKHVRLAEQEGEAGEEPEEEKGTTTIAKRSSSQSQTERPNLLLIGFIQNWNTLKHINQEYRHSIRWFFLGCIFGEAAASAFITVAVIVLTEEWGLNASEVGIFFVVGLLAITIACKPGEWVANWTNPNTSWRIAMLYTFTISVIGALTLNRDNAKPWSFVWGFVVSIGLGWHYQAQYLYVTLITPKDQEAEMAGFFNYCRIILTWLPPLLFSLLVEANISQSIGIIATNCFFLLGVACLSLSAPWEEALEEVHGKKQEKNATKEEEEDGAENDDNNDNREEEEQQQQDTAPSQPQPQEDVEQGSDN